MPAAPIAQLFPVDNSLEADFDDFWLLYPKKVARKDARIAWARVSEVDRMAAIVAMVNWRRIWRMRGDDQFIPHAATWLNAERWSDELPNEFTQSGHASHVVAELPQATERVPMPEKVRAYLAKLRAK